MSVKALGCAMITFLLFYFLDQNMLPPLGKAVLSVSGKCVDRVGFSWCGSPGAGCLFTLFPYRKVREKVRPHII